MMSQNQQQTERTEYLYTDLWHYHNSWQKILTEKKLNYEKNENKKREKNSTVFSAADLQTVLEELEAP